MNEKLQPLIWLLNAERLYYSKGLIIRCIHYSSPQRPQFKAYKKAQKASFFFSKKRKNIYETLFLMFFHALAANKVILKITQKPLFTAHL